MEPISKDVYTLIKIRPFGLPLAVSCVQCNPSNKDTSLVKMDIFLRPITVEIRSVPCVSRKDLSLPTTAGRSGRRRRGEGDIGPGSQGNECPREEQSQEKGTPDGSTEFS